MPTCEDCGQEVDAEWNLCPNCGAEVAVEGTAPETERGTESPAAEAPTRPAEDADLPSVSRRAVLGLVGGGVGLVALGVGALQFVGQAPHEEAGPDAWTDRTERTDGGARQVSGRVVLAPGEFLVERFSVSGGAQLGARVTAVENGPFDVYTLAVADLPDYRAASRVSFVSEISESGISRARSVRGFPPAGEYALILDNTAAYDAEPSGELAVELTMGVGDI